MKVYNLPVRSVKYKLILNCANELFVGCGYQRTRRVVKIGIHAGKPSKGENHLISVVFDIVQCCRVRLKLVVAHILRDEVLRDRTERLLPIVVRKCDQLCVPTLFHLVRAHHLFNIGWSIVSQVSRAEVVTRVSDIAPRFRFISVDIAAES